MRLLTILILLAAFLPSSAQVEMINEGFSTYGGNVGGKDEFKHIFEHQVFLPDSLTDQKFERRVVLGMAISPTGEVKNVEVKESGGPVLDQEAIRILHLIEWEPGVYRSQPTETHKTLTFVFNSKKISKLYKKRGYTKPVFYTATVEQLAIVSKADTLAAYSDGLNALGTFLATNLIYPTEARSKNIRGDVVLSFIVEPDGYASNIKVERSLGGGCDQEAIRVLRLMKWKPAVAGGVPVRSRLTLPVRFNLETGVHNNVNTEQRMY